MLDKLMNKEFFQFVTGIVAIIALVILNIWGKDDGALNSLLYSVAGAGVWGGLVASAAKRKAKSVAFARTIEGDKIVR